MQKMVEEMMKKVEKELLTTVLNAPDTEILEYPLYYMVNEKLIRENEDGKKFIVKFDENKKETIIGEYNGK
jgi:hypothetical protein